MYLFHELPQEVRRAAAAEMARVLKPGGILILTDSVQFGDRTAWDKTLGNFSNFNEPYYLSYITEDLGEPLNPDLFCQPPGGGEADLPLRPQRSLHPKGMGEDYNGGMVRIGE